MKKLTKYQWFDILVSPYMLALPIAIFIILMLPDMFQKYVVTQTFAGRSNRENSIEEYHDLDNDGYSERVIAFHNMIGRPAVKVLRNDGNVLDQWNFSGKYLDNSVRFFCADLNADSLKEIYVFTCRHDSLFLNAFDPMNQRKILFTNRLITTFNFYGNKGDVRLSFPKTVDLDGDGVNELMVRVHGGFSKQPRGLFVYDAVKDTIFRTPVMGVCISSVVCADMDNDGKTEVYCSSSTLGNISDSLGIPFSDYSAWVMGFDSHLHFLFPPIQYPAYPSSCNIVEIASGNKKRIVACYKNRSPNHLPSKLVMYDEKGKTIREKTAGQGKLPDFLNSQLFTVNYKGTPVIAKMAKDKSLVLLDTLFAVVKKINLHSPDFKFKADLDLDGNKEFLFVIPDFNIMITHSGFESPVIINVDRNPFSKMLYCISVKKNGNKLPEIFINTDNKVYMYTYSFNKLYYMKFPIWLGIYLAVLFVILIIRHIQKIQLQRKLEIESRLNALQLRTIKSQMDPHFMFNTLNSISTSILNQQTETAYRFLVKFSTLLRSMFLKAGELTVSLDEQLKFVNNYLELEKLRFKERINYDIVVDPGVDKNIRLPHMFIQLFVENAIKHGLRHKNGNGYLLIKITQDTSLMKIIIEDDGIGRQAAAQHHDGHGKGTVIINEMVGLYAKVKGIHIKYYYEDLTDKAGNPAGTKVVVEVPVVPPDLSVR